jgi:hypothetical protein
MARGDQIYVYRQLLDLEGAYQHHGIDGGDRTVIHYRKPSETIERTPWEVFSKGNTVYIKEYTTGFCFLPDAVVRRAESRLGEHQYNLLFNNCEHFATWCKTGIAHSQQIRDFAPLGAKFNTSKLAQTLEESLKKTDSYNADAILNHALEDIRVVWEQIQPQYKTALADTEAWQKVARESVKRNRDDLARGALLRKNQAQQRVQELKEQLDHLGRLTQELINSRNRSIPA